MYRLHPSELHRLRPLDAEAQGLAPPLPGSVEEERAIAAIEDARDAELIDRADTPAARARRHARHWTRHYTGGAK